LCRRKYAAHGLFWWRSQLLAYVLRPTPGDARCDRRRARSRSLDNGEPYIGMHIRRGAKWMETPVMPVERYVAAAAAHARRAAERGLPVPRRVFVATDAADVIETLERDFAANFTWIFRRETYRHTAHNVTWMIEIQRRWQAASTDVVDAIRDVWLLAEANYVVVHLLVQHRSRRRRARIRVAQQGARRRRHVGGQAVCRRSLSASSNIFGPRSEFNRKRRSKK
jgi:hypothetical protein